MERKREREALEIRQSHEKLRRGVDKQNTGMSQCELEQTTSNEDTVSVVSGMHNRRSVRPDKANPERKMQVSTTSALRAN